MSYSICTDIGGSKIYTGIVKNNRVFKSHKILNAKEKGLKYLLKNIRESIEIYEPQKAKNICASFAGPVNARGEILHATNFPPYLVGYNIKKEIKAWSKKPTFVEHDGLCFTLAESTLGAGKNYNYVAAITLGSGIGGGFAVNKKVYKGNLSLAEIGHFKITEKGLRCSCGKYGHFESQASGPALSKYFKKITGQTLKGEEIHKLALKGNKPALLAAKEMAYYLGIGLASLANLLSPEIIVIGGGVSQFKEIITLSQKTFKNEVLDPRHKNLKIVKSKLEHNALLLGAYLTSKGNYLIQ